MMYIGRYSISMLKRSNATIYIFVTYQVSYKRHELIFILEYLGSPTVLGGGGGGPCYASLQFYVLRCAYWGFVFVVWPMLPFLWIVHSLFPLRFSLTFIYYSYIDTTIYQNTNIKSHHLLSGLLFVLSDLHLCHSMFHLICLI